LAYTTWHFKKYFVVLTYKRDEKFSLINQYRVIKLEILSSMSRIQIADLQTGTELFQGNESFLTELQPVEANAIYGGSKKKTGGKSSGGCKVGKSSVKSSGGCGGPGPSPSPLPSPIGGAP
jgi:hypothetical protein